MNLPTGTRGRLVAVGILLIGLILLGNYVVMPGISHYQEMREDIAAKQYQVQRYGQIIDSLPALKKSVAELDRTRPLQPYLLDGDNRALAAANLQTRLQRIADNEGVKIVSLRVRDSETDGPFERIPVDVHLQSTLEPLHKVLLELENSRPVLFTESLSIQTRVQRRTRRGSRTSDELDARITLYGLRSPGSGNREG